MTAATRAVHAVDQLHAVDLPSLVGLFPPGTTPDVPGARFAAVVATRPTHADLMRRDLP